MAMRLREICDEEEALCTLEGIEDGSLPKHTTFVKLVVREEKDGDD
jgi:hypothetical protein